MSERFSQYAVKVMSGEARGLRATLLRGAMAIAEPIYTRAIGRWKNYASALEPALEALEPFVREFGYAHQSN